MSLGGRLAVGVVNAGSSFRSQVNFIAHPQAGVRRVAALVGKRIKVRSIDTKYWPATQRCCATSAKLCAEGKCCAEQYSNVLVYRLRKYFDSLSDGNQRNFLKDRQINLQRGVPSPDADVTGKRLFGGFQMESPNSLREYLTLHEAGKLNVFPSPLQSITQYMCTKFAMNMVMKSLGWLYPHCVPSSNRFAPAGFRTAADRQFPTQSEPKVYVRGQPKMASAISWMKEQSQLHLILPNNEGTVLPFSTKYSAHATYVNDLEASFGFEHQEASANMLNARQMQVEEAVEEDQQQQLLDEEAHDHDAAGEGLGPTMQRGLDDLVSQDDEVLEQDSSGPRRPQSKYRYGNPLLGLCSEIPVCDGLAAYTTFVRLWRHSVTQRNAAAQVDAICKVYRML